ncbi:MAG: fumarylacetoacetate hydrolase family protein [Rubrivivax sp.]
MNVLMHARQARAPAPIPPKVAALAPGDAYALQAAHEDAVLRVHGGRRIGTKLGGGTMDDLRKLGLRGPFRGPIFSAFRHVSPARLARADFFVCAVEAEIAVVLGRDLVGRDGLPPRAEVAAAIDAVLPAIEVADSRWSDFAQASAGAVLADLGFAGAWVAGEPVRDWRGIDLAAVTVRLLGHGRELSAGVGMRAMGDPLLGVCHALAEMGPSGGFKAGDIISTGTCTAPYMARAGDSLLADFGPLGQVQLELV